MFASNLTGGPAWHWQAWRSQKAWAPTVGALEKWLLTHTIETSKSELLLIGASAGWMMPNSWLCQFEKVCTYDIDPLAARFFKWRHGSKLKANGVELQCHTQNALSDLPALLHAHPQACVFFDNVLGQLRFNSFDVHLVEKNIARIVKSLQGREWGSVHDRMSGPVSDDVRISSNSNERWPQAQGHLNSKEAQKWLGRLNAQSPWLDHLTENVFTKDTAVHNLAWAFKPTYWHWLQAGWVKP